MSDLTERFDERLGEIATYLELVDGIERVVRLSRGVEREVKRVVCNDLVPKFDDQRERTVEEHRYVVPERRPERAVVG